MPTAPRNPTALLDLEAIAGERIRVSKRDAKCYFDQLALPATVRSWFGRPPVTVAALADYTDLTQDELRRYLPAGVGPSRDFTLWPTCTTWPMGFAWSSFIAQSKLLKCCESAGLGTSRMLADDLPTPSDMSCTFALATDDVMLFTSGEAANAHPWLARLDAEIDKAGIQAHASKAVTAVHDETVIGVDLCQGQYLSPHASKLALVMSGCSHFLKTRSASRIEVGALMGHLGWFALLARATFGCFHSIYAHSCSPTGAERDLHFGERMRDGVTDSVMDASVRRDVPKRAAAEIFTFIALTPLLEVDLTRDWQDHLVACDASDTVGFGASVAPCSRELTRQVGRAGKKRDVHVRTTRDGLSPDEEPERPRRGEELRIPLSKAAFSTVVSARRRFHGHSGALEAHGVTLALRWVTRSARRHSRRTTLLIDARTVLGALAKGRSSAETLRREIRRAGAYILAADLLVKPVYIPSEENPADAPSRGIVRRFRARRTPAPRSAPALKSLIPFEKKRHLKPKKKPFDVLAHYQSKMDALLHEGPVAERFFWRRFMRTIDSDYSSCTSLTERDGSDAAGSVESSGVQNGS